MDLSIIIPTFNEETKIRADILAAGAFLDAFNFEGEIIIADDGSSDKTPEVAQKSAFEITSPVRIEALTRNLGKGAALRQGVAVSRGDLILYADSGLCIPYPFAAPAIERILHGETDLAFASRKLPQTTIVRSQTRERRFFSKLFRYAVIATMRIPARLTDTQCGFKIYRGAIGRELFAACQTNGFMFEIEIIKLALNAGYRIAEFPVEWSCDPDTRLTVRRSIKSVIAELWDIHRRLG